MDLVVDFLTLLVANPRLNKGLRLLILFAVCSAAYPGFCSDGNNTPISAIKCINLDSSASNNFIFSK